MPASIPSIDWQPPWLQGLPRVSMSPDLARVHQALNAAGPCPVRFVPQDALPPGMAYEQFIHATGQVPTRDNLHDFFNGLVWLRFPQAKRRLNQLHAQAIAAQGVGATRGPLRDAATLLDENGALLLAPEALWQALRARQWRRLFVELRPLWRQARLAVFGHALLEQLVHPRKPLTAHVYQARTAPDSVADLDAWLAADLDAAHLAAKPFTPLPVLGVPGWWPENENFSFYDDSLVFRSARPNPKNHTTGPVPAARRGA
ncbi:DUF3025 domain-containing protein [Acidovorax sp. YS12]|nr:DUF3025 domain-containing protein [Acidovorax sp. YS12]